ncbi:two-component system CitB family sensor kinase [Arthrobacter woluwensis]|uniref:sensor histidine kinase n=1 Tax=Arthrobacter woluwensis TaxID=156980 RepID=UPI00277F227D|nr:sensor histidine kinase [Arthrobacter woluwensis]MDQ0708110.1 two-component system CitB family sensor kinase [Arthrobacter woluwensis]
MRTLKFSTQTLLLQIAVVLLTVLLFALAFGTIMVERITQEAEQRALTLARTIASQPQVRQEVARISAATGTPPSTVLDRGPLESIAESARQRTSALFVVITDETGVRLAHPDPQRLAEKVSTDPSEALAGKEVVTRNTGTLGPSAGAKVPVYAPDTTAGGAAAVVGVVSVGFAREPLGSALLGASGPVIVTACGALAAGVGASMLLRKRLRRLTLGMEPEELTTLVQDQVAVLETTHEGVIGVSTSGRVTVVNATAQELLGLPDLQGTPWADAPVPEPLRDLTRQEAAEDDVLELVVGARVLLATARKAVHDGEDLGWVVFLRDRTELAQLTRQLESVSTMSSALRAQRHEFANQLHTISGLLDLGDTARAAEYAHRLVETGPLEFPVEGLERLPEPYLQAFIGAKGIRARERGVTLRVGEDTFIRGSVKAPHDVTTVLGNLIDNAINAAVSGTRVSEDGEDGADGERWVRVDLLDEPGPEPLDGSPRLGTLHAVVADSGDGVAEPDRLFEKGYTASRVPGHGLGLKLALELAQRRGGEVKLLAAGGPGSGEDGTGSGAVFAVRLPTAMMFTTTSGEDA